jgi:hypothetical protein
MPSINIYVPKRTKDIMNVNTHVNWSKIANDAFNRHIESFDMSKPKKFRLNYVNNPYYVDGPFVWYGAKDDTCNGCVWYPLGWSE